MPHIGSAEFLFQRLGGQMHRAGDHVIRLIRRQRSAEYFIQHIGCLQMRIHQVIVQLAESPAHFKADDLVSRQGTGNRQAA